MNRLNIYIAAFLTGAIAFNLNGCGSPSAKREDSTNLPPIETIATTPAPNQPIDSTTISIPQPNKMAQPSQPVIQPQYSAPTLLQNQPTDRRAIATSPQNDAFRQITRPSALPTTAPIEPTNSPANDPFRVNTDVISTQNTAPTPAPIESTTQTATAPLINDDRVEVNLKPSPSSTANIEKTVNVTIYQADSQCQSLVAQQVNVPVSRTVEAAVAKVMELRDSADFDLAGYRVKVNQKTGVATVDMRLSPDAKRKFTSMTSCEQLALFGSLRKTLLNNSQWQIKDVRFTQENEEIYL